MKIFPDNEWQKWNASTESYRVSNYKQRIQILESLEQSIKKYTEDIYAALTADLKKPRTEALLTEIAPVMQEIHFFKKNLKSWMKPEKVDRPLSLLGTTNWIQFEAKGKILILSPWNYPYRLAMNPLIAAIAAGNTVVLKASEHSSQTTAIIYKIIQNSAAHEIVRCIDGGPETAKELLDLAFDHIFFTGGTEIGREVMMKAAKNLCPVTLELGGKSPTFILKDAVLKNDLEKILWGKFMNAGQTCVAPDYLLLHKSHLEEFRKASAEILKRFYTDKAQTSSSYARMIHRRHTENLVNALNDSLSSSEGLIYGGSHNLDEKYIEPTIVLNPKLQSKLMEQEIFGPILPVLTFENLDEAIGLVKEYGRPLALYVFTSEEKDFDKITSQILSGAALQNAVTTHLANPHLPFGGIGPSGMGRYHGKFGFIEMSHMRAYQKLPRVTALKAFFPPYDKIEKKLDAWKDVLYKL